MSPEEHLAWLQADADDRRFAIDLAGAADRRLAEQVYDWLRERPSLRTAALRIEALDKDGNPMTTPNAGLTIPDGNTSGDSLTVSAKDAAGFSTPDAGPFTWSVAPDGVASVNDNGDGTASITPVAPGSANVGCQDANGLQAAPFAVTVEAGPAESLTISASGPDVPPAPTPPAGA
jgi:hypothetical protein